MVLSRYHVVTPALWDQQDGIAKRLVFATRTAQRRVIDVESWQRIQRGETAWLPPAVLADLAEIELLVPEGQDELAVILSRNAAALERDDVLCLGIEPSALCQMGCDYCGQAHENVRLSAENQERLVGRARNLLQQRAYRVLRVSWYGAEPLLGLDVIRALAPRLRQAAEEGGCQYRSVMITNGLELTEAVAAELAGPLGVQKFQVTLDGTAATHDARRPTKGGGPTFARILANVAALARRDDLEASVAVRSNVDRRNCHDISPLIRTLAEAGVLERLADFIIRPVHDWGNDAGGQALAAEEFAELEIKWLSELIALGFTPQGLVPQREELLCLAVMPRSVLVDPHGRLFNCGEASLVAAPPRQRGTPAAAGGGKNPAWQLPVLSTSEVYSLGDLERGEQPGRRQVLGDFAARLAQGQYACHTCRMLPVCGGSCPKHWLEGGMPCPSTKFNIEARLLLSYAVARLESPPSAPPA